MHLRKLGFNHYMMVCSLSKKYLASTSVLVQRMFEMRCLYTGGSFKQNVEKIR